MKSVNDVVFVSAVRTAIGTFGGTLKDMPACDLATVAVREAFFKGRSAGRKS